MKHPTVAFTSKSLTGAETHYCAIEREALGILHGLKFLHCCFTNEVSMITDHKLLVAIFKNDVVSLLIRLQRIVLWIHQFNVGILNKPGPQLYIAEWQSRLNHETNR